MGYAEKHGKGYRARWRDPLGNLQSMSGFPTKRTAEVYANDQEADVRASRYLDPRAGQMPVNDWIDTWYASLDLELSTMEQYRYFLETCVRPFFVGRTLASLTPEEINVWERDLVKVYGYAPSTARGARARLVSALEAAVPSKIARNPALRPRAKGKRADRRIARVMERRRTYATPLEILLVAERVGLLAGQGAFVQTIFHAWTGARWSEGVGFDPACYHGTTIDIDWKLYELNGRFYRGRPKDGSIRTIDVPPFLQFLLDRHLKDQPTLRCKCKKDMPAPYCSGREYVFLGPEGGHMRRSSWSRRVLRPAADGAYPGQPKKGVPSRPVMANLSVGWPGAPIPKVSRGPDGVFEVPAFRGFQPHGSRSRAAGVNSRSPRAQLVAYAVEQGARLKDLEGVSREVLLDRYVRTAYVAQDAPVVAWRPILSGLVNHESRHSQETWMSEDGVPVVMRDDRSGHTGSGHVRERYEHPTDVMRELVVTTQQQRWEAALMQRAAMERHWSLEAGTPGSALPLLDESLAPFRESVAPIRPLRLRSRPQPMRDRRSAAGL
ncbi:hypothetical protein SAMN05216275_1411 [Streptosporangium canum]|uniref:Core-binding (CB) domain-containing protein n=1 Tax=Streptosporangium canum TaxID=324952 RepID=A0A1I4DFV1_9ACTN|nr:hypothetical protein [Streptosporangium canum]SFK91357.1 hypothetical protein SAMN05216275_1411 [Streptosporangium canum]